MRNRYVLLLGILISISAVSAVHGEEIGLKWNFQSSSGIWTVDITEDGSYAVAGSYDNYVYFFDGSGNLLWNYKTGDTVWSVAVSEKGDYAVAGSKDRNVYFFDGSGNLLWNYKTGDTVWSVDISRDGKYIVAGSYDNNVYFFDRSGRLLWKFKAFDIVLSTAISGDGEYVVAGSYDNNVYFFDRSGRLLWKFKAKDEIWGVDISQDGRYVVAGSRDNAVYFLNSLGELLSKYTTKYFVSSVSTSSTGEKTVAGSYDNNVYYLVKTTTRPPKPTYPKVIALKTAHDRELLEGGTTTVEVTLQNIGDGVARNVRLTDAIPLGFELVMGNTTWTGELDPGGVEVVTYSIKAKKLSVSEKVTYELPEVNVTYEDVRGVFYSFTGASILVTVNPKAPEEKPPPAIGNRVSSYIGMITKGKEKLYLSLAGGILVAIAVALLALRRRHETAIRREKVRFLQRLKGEIGQRLVPPEKHPPGRRSFPLFRGGARTYKGETLNLLNNIKAMVRSGERPTGVETFPKKPGGSILSAVPYWLKALAARKESKAYREKNVTLLENIKETIG
jgi:uncharacterized repeat protein (TIGR01451 family)